MKTSTAIAGFVVCAALGFTVGYSAKVARRAPPRVEERTDQNGPKVDVGPLYKVPVGDSYRKGANDALVTIVEFSDFQCPFCARVKPTLKKILETYGRDIRLVFKNLPLAWHREAPLAAEFALAAGEQGKFWEMHDLLFEQHGASAGPSLDRRSLIDYATRLGLDVTKIEAYIASGKGKEIIRHDLDLARALGAHGAPAFFINGARITGSQPLKRFQDVIDFQRMKARELVESGVPRDQVYEEVLKEARHASPPARKQARTTPGPKPATRQKVRLRNTSPRIGGKYPQVTIVVFSDFQCPFSARSVPTIKRIVEEYGNQVQVRFRNQPLDFHKRAIPAARAALAAGEQGKFWEMHDILFDNQRALEDRDFLRYAKRLKLKIREFKRDMGSTAVGRIIREDQRDARAYGAVSTPTLFINGVPIRGAQPYPLIKAMIDREIQVADSLLQLGIKRQRIYGEILRREGGKKVRMPSPSVVQRSLEPARQRPLIVLDRAPLYGKKEAPVKVVLYSDFECEPCARLKLVVDQIAQVYGNKVVVGFKHFPLASHRNAELAAVASLAAHRQGMFWPMHDKLFQEREALSRADIMEYAKALNLKLEAFEQDIADPVLQAWMSEDRAEAVKLGISGPPGVFVNGRKVAAHSFEAIKAVIDLELPK